MSLRYTIPSRADAENLEYAVNLYSDEAKISHNVYVGGLFRSQQSLGRECCFSADVVAHCFEVIVVAMTT